MADSHRKFNRVFLVFWGVKQSYKFLEALTGCLRQQVVLRTVHTCLN
jgi:hypothetical protein